MAGEEEEQEASADPPGTCGSGWARCVWPDAGRVLPASSGWAAWGHVRPLGRLAARWEQGVACEGAAGSWPSPRQWRVGGGAGGGSGWCSPAMPMAWPVEQPLGCWSLLPGHPSLILPATVSRPNHPPYQLVVPGPGGVLLSCPSAGNTPPPPGPALPQPGEPQSTGASRLVLTKACPFRAAPRPVTVFQLHVSHRASASDLPLPSSFLSSLPAWFEPLCFAPPVAASPLSQQCLYLLNADWHAPPLQSKLSLLVSPSPLQHPRRAHPLHTVPVVGCMS